MKKHTGLLCLTLLLLASACTQQPANVVYRGGDFYGREHEGFVDSRKAQTFAEDSPRYKRGYSRPAEPAGVDSVSVSDLPPPGASAHAASRDTPFQKAQPPLESVTTMPVEEGWKETPPAKTAAAEPVAEAIPEPASEPVTIAGNAPAPALADAKPAAGNPAAQFIWPVEGGKVTTRFTADNVDKGNDGINIALSEGEPIVASAPGTVVYSGNELKGFGNMVILRHPGGWMTAYAHARSVSVSKGAKVNQGDIIGFVGSTGGVKTPQLHFVLRKGKNPVDPELYLPPKG